jgi:hypothetical protein
LPTAATTRLALDILTFWSSRKNFEYLIFIKSFPAARFQVILKEVLQRAIHFGLVMTEKMKRMCVELRLVTCKEELIATLLGNFARTTDSPEGSDLEPQARVDNWRLLQKDAEMHGVGIKPAIAGSISRAEADLKEGQNAIPLDLADGIELFSTLSQLEQEELIELLADKASRVDAMRALAESGQEELIPRVLSTFGNLSRSEMEALGDDLACFGQVLAAPLKDRMDQLKPFQRLGALRTLVRLQGEEVVHLLIHEVVAGARSLRRPCMELLANLDDPPLEEILAMSGHDQADVRIRLAELLSLMTGPVCSKRLRQMADDDPSEKVRRHANRLLKRTNSTKTLSKGEAV